MRIIGDAHQMGSMIDFNCKLKCKHCTHKDAIYYGNSTLFCWFCKVPTPMTRDEYFALKAEQIKERINNQRSIDWYTKVYNEKEDWELAHINNVLNTTGYYDQIEDELRKKVVAMVISNRLQSNQ